MKRMVIGVMIGLMIGTAGTALATSETVQAVFQKFNFKVNGQELHLEADPLVYQGTTYLPVRVVANMLGYDVTYRHDSRTIELNLQDPHALEGTPVPNQIEQGDESMEATIPVYQIGEEITLGSLTLRINSVVKIDSYNEFVASEGQIFAIVNFDAFTSSEPADKDYWAATSVVRGATTSTGKFIVGGMFGAGEKGQFNPNQQANVEVVIPIGQDQEISVLMVSDPSDPTIAAEIIVQ